MCEMRTLRDRGLKSIYVPIIGINIMRRSHFMKFCSQLEWEELGKLIQLLTNHYESRIFGSIDIMLVWRK